MKVSVYLLTLILFSVGLPALHAQEYGKIRALNQRAAYVIKQRNDFVAQVLTSYAIPHERNKQGVVVRIKTDSRWLDVTTIEIVPVLKIARDKRQQVAAHELFFYTANGGILNLLSELTIH
ncbi:MAG: hypothetical protein Q8M86_04435 [Syntrophales bacterium]|nr:hypothetical protein [Syntrophales bacterium]